MFFRKAQPEDAAATKSFEWKIPAEDIAAGDVYVAGEESVEGFAIFNRSFFQRPWIAVLFVDAGRRRRGVAKALMRGIETLCRPGEKIFISTSLCNVPMQGLLHSLGYRMTGVIEHLGPQPELFYFKVITEAEAT